MHTHQTWPKLKFITARYKEGKNYSVANYICQKIKYFLML